ncbi:hypothetical protein ACWE42_24565 [Sutcliffiella cohnii]
MDMSSSGKVPEGLRKQKKYPVGSKTIITDAHMEGMEGATRYKKYL